MWVGFSEGWEIVLERLLEKDSITSLASTRFERRLERVMPGSRRRSASSVTGMIRNEERYDESRQL